MYITDNVMCLRLVFNLVVQNVGDYILQCYLILQMYKRGERVFLPGSALKQFPTFPKIPTFQKFPNFPKITKFFKKMHSFQISQNFQNFFRYLLGT